MSNFWSSRNNGIYIRFLGVGIFSFFFELITFFCLVFLDFSLLLSTVGSKSITAILAFLLQRHFVFKSSQSIKKEAAKYLVAIVFISFFSYATLTTLIYVSNSSLYWVKIVTELLIVFISFILQRLFVFRTPADFH